MPSTLSQRLGEIFAFLILATAVVSLGAWATGHGRLTALGINYIAMAPITALMFFLGGLVLALQTRWSEQRATQIFGAFALALVVIVGGAVLFASWRSLVLPWDHWLVRDHESDTTLTGGRMSPLTAVAFLCSALGLSAGVLRSPGPGLVRLTVVASSAGFLVAVVVLVSYAGGMPLLYGGQSVPMAVSTALAMLTLNLGALFASRGGEFASTLLRPNDASATPAAVRILKRRLMVGGLVVAAGILIVSIIHFRAGQDEMRRAVQRELNAVADLKAGEILRWREERLAEARFLMRVNFVAEDLAALVARPSDPAARARVLDWLEPIKGGDRYASVLVADATGHVLLTLPDILVPPRHAKDHVLAVAGNGAATLTDIQPAEDGSEIHLDLIAPIFAPHPPGQASGSGSAPIAVILFTLDPERVLFPLIRSWPTPSPTAETLLVRREDDEIVYLNDVRHQSGTSLTLRRSVHEPTLSAAMAARGEFGVREGVDYRGVAVLSSARPIPNSPWLILAKVDQDEIYAPVRQKAWTNGMLTLLLLSGLWAGATMIWRQRQTDSLRRDLVQRRQHERQIERMTRLYAALSHVNQTIVRSRGREEIFREVCRVLVEFGGFKLVWVGWLDPVTSAVDRVADFGDDTGYLKAFRVYADERPEGRGPTGTAVRENRTYICNDFMADPRMQPWWEAATRAGIRSSIALPVRMQGRAMGALTAYAGEIDFFGAEEVALLEEAAADLAFALENQEKDQRRRETEAALYASEARFRALFESSLIGLLITIPEEDKILAANPAACRMLGRTEAEICQLGSDGLVDPTDTRRIAFKQLSQRTGRADGELRLLRADRSFFEAELSTAVFDTPDGLRTSVTFSDITDRKRAELRMATQVEELSRWHALTLGRESRVLDLKREVNDLLVRNGQPPRYSSFGDDASPPMPPENGPPKGGNR